MTREVIADPLLKLQILRRRCPLDDSFLKHRRVLERYPFSTFRNSKKGDSKHIRLSGCRGRHVYHIYIFKSKEPPHITIDYVVVRTR